MMQQAESGAMMICSQCEVPCKRFGKHRNGLLRFRCRQCKRTYTEPHEKPLGRMTVPLEKAVLTLQLLLEGASVRSTERITELHRDTILRLLVLAGKKCERLMAAKFRKVPAKELQLDEIWCYVGKKDKRVRPGDGPECGSQFVFVAIDPVTKLVPSFVVGKRDGATAHAFATELHSRVAGQVQITTDGFRPYIAALDDSFGADCDYAMLIKTYGAADDGTHNYAPPRIAAIFHQIMWGNPDEAKICTSHVERQNLTMRMQMRRFTRLTNAFSKKLDNLKAALALHFAYYDFCRIHQTLRVTPAMEAGLTDHIWGLQDLLKES